MSFPLDDSQDAPAGQAPETAAPAPPRLSVPPPQAPTYAGERILLDYKDQGYGLYLMAGIGGVGKTQLLDAYQKSRPFLTSIRSKQSDIRVASTLSGSFACYPVRAGNRKAVFVDASGEDFRMMYPHQRISGQLSDTDARFLSLVADSLQGLALVVELRRLWGEPLPGEMGDSGNRHQERILAWILELLRWFRFGGEYNPDSALPFQDQVDAGVQRLRRRQRLDFPIQVIFSKADHLQSVPLPPSASLFGQVAPSRTLFPMGEHPLLLAYHHLPVLYAALKEHARHFRFDFAHSLVLDPDGQSAVDETPCGVNYSLSWLLERSGRLTPGTDAWVRLQRRIDRLCFRGNRWRRLPEPREFDHG